MLKSQTNSLVIHSLNVKTTFCLEEKQILINFCERQLQNNNVLKLPWLARVDTLYTTYLLYDACTAFVNNLITNNYLTLLLRLRNKLFNEKLGLSRHILKHFVSNSLLLTLLVVHHRDLLPNTTFA